VEVDQRNEKLGFKIRAAEVLKTPVIAVVGDKEAAAVAVAPRWRGVASQGAPAQPVAAFVAEVVERARVPIAAAAEEPVRARVH
jgi:threonyl-tRNA synthetase